MSKATAALQSLAPMVQAAKLPGALAKSANEVVSTSSAVVAGVGGLLSALLASDASTFSDEVLRAADDKARALMLVADPTLGQKIAAAKEKRVSAAHELKKHNDALQALQAEEKRERIALEKKAQDLSTRKATEQALEEQRAKLMKEQQTLQSVAVSSVPAGAAAGGSAGKGADRQAEVTKLQDRLAKMRADEEKEQKQLKDVETAWSKMERELEVAQAESVRIAEVHNAAVRRMRDLESALATARADAATVRASMLLPLSTLQDLGGVVPPVVIEPVPRTLPAQCGKCGARAEHILIPCGDVVCKRCMTARPTKCPVPGCDSNVVLLVDWNAAAGSGPSSAAAPASAAAAAAAPAPASASAASGSGSGGRGGAKPGGKKGAGRGGR